MSGVFCVMALDHTVSGHMADEAKWADSKITSHVIKLISLLLSFHTETASFITIKYIPAGA
jgi:hypothetical protein